MNLNKKKSELTRQFIDGFRDKLALVLVFSLGYGFLGPFIHELVQGIVLLGTRCGFDFSPGLNWFTGLRGDYKLSCGLNGLPLFLLYFSGYFSTFLASLGFFQLSERLENGSIYWSVLGLGCLVSILGSLTLTGDIDNALAVYQLDIYSAWFKMFLVGSVFAFTFLEVERIHKRY